jgi:hypothetical protein
MLRVPAPGWVCVLCRSEDVDSCGCHTCTHVQTVRGLAWLVCVLSCFAWCRQFGHVDGHGCMRAHCSCIHALLWLLLPSISWHDSGPTLGPGWSTQPKAFEGRHCSFFCDGCLLCGRVWDIVQVSLHSTWRGGVFFVVHAMETQLSLVYGKRQQCSSRLRCMSDSFGALLVALFYGGVLGTSDSYGHVCLFWRCLHSALLRGCFGGQ